MKQDEIDEEMDPTCLSCVHIPVCVTHRRGEGAIYGGPECCDYEAPSSENLRAAISQADDYINQAYEQLPENHEAVRLTRAAVRHTINGLKALSDEPIWWTDGKPVNRAAAEISEKHLARADVQAILDKNDALIGAQTKEVTLLRAIRAAAKNDKHVMSPEMQDALWDYDKLQEECAMDGCDSGAQPVICDPCWQKAHDNNDQIIKDLSIADRLLGGCRKALGKHHTDDDYMHIHITSFIDAHDALAEQVEDLKKGILNTLDNCNISVPVATLLRRLLVRHGVLDQ